MLLGDIAAGRIQTRLAPYRRNYADPVTSKPVSRTTTLFSGNERVLYPRRRGNLAEAVHDDLEGLARSR